MSGSLTTETTEHTEKNNSVISVPSVVEPRSARPIALSRVRRALVTGLACLASVVTSPDSGLVAAPGAPSPFADCEPRPGENWTYNNLMCLRQVGITHNVRDDVIRRLRAMGGGDAAHPWPTLVLAHVTLDQLQRTQAIALYEIAAESFARSRDAEGEVVTRQNLANQYRLLGQADVAARHVAKAVAAAESSRQPLIMARAAVVEASQSMATGGDIGRAHRALLRADRLASRAAPIGLRRTILFNLANASLYLGQTDAAIDALERHRALRAEDGSQQDAAMVRLNLLIARLMLSERRPSPGARERLVADAEAVLTEAQSAKDPLVEAKAHQVLGDLLARTDAERATGHLTRCLALGATLNFPSVRAACQWSLSRNESSRDSRRAEQASAKALSLLDTEHDRLLLAYAWEARLRLVWRTLPEDQAITQSLEALDAIERLRSGQRDESSRAGLFGNWVRDYEWLTGELLQAREPRLAQAFEVGERLRSRVVLERMAQAGVSGAPPGTRDEAQQQLARRIAETQRQLLSTSLDEAQRRMSLGQLRLLELEREDLNEGRVPAMPSSAMPFATLDTVQRTLDEHEVMVWFSMAPWTDVYDEFGGGSWAVTITRQTTSIHRLMADDDLDAQAGALIGLLRDRRTNRDVWAPAARRLGETLLGGALAPLPSTITRLILVTDGALHRMPFEVLALRTGPMLGERFDVSVTPSATLWQRMRESPAPSSAGVLVLADPDVRGSPDGEVRLSPLPGARREAGAIARIMQLGPDQLRQGSAASERYVKQARLATFSVVHIAAHARADAVFPERSAVFLAPGGAGEDGWLQPGEIGELDLRGRLIVLSACDSAEGALLSGEGPMSLARAFFSGGARGVVATRWPLRDDDAAIMMELFYEALGDGASVAAALRRARRVAIERGLPAAAWAGIVALGDGLQQPIVASHARGKRWSATAAVTLAAMTLATIGLGALWLRRSRALTP